MCRPLLFLGVAVLLACRAPLAASGGPPLSTTSIPSRSCAGNAPVDDAIKGVPRVRASWFNPSSAERLYVLEAGPTTPKLPTLVLIHGVGVIGTGDFYPVLAALSHNRHVLAVDLPGFGRSNLGDNDFGPERLVQAVDTVVRACGTKKIDVLGHSSGGALALLFAGTHTEMVRKLIVVDAAGILRPEVLLRGQLHQGLTEMREEAPLATKAIEKMAGIMITTMHAFTPSATSLAKTGLLGRSPPVLAATRLLDYNFGEAILGIRADTLILWGKNDHVMPPRIAHLLDDRIAHSELKFLEDAGHVPMKDQPELFATIVTGYLNEGMPGVPGLTIVEPGPAGISSSNDGEAPNTSAREGRCDGQEDVILEGDFASIEVSKCKRVWLNRVRARRISVRDSEGRLDRGRVTEGVSFKDSEFSLTGGELRGAIALQTTDSKLDVAGVQILGTDIALKAIGKNEIAFSVSPLASPKTARMMHESIAPEVDYEM